MEDAILAEESPLFGPADMVMLASMAGFVLLAVGVTLYSVAVMIL